MKKKVASYLKIIDKIEKTRTKNNVNWMNIIRIALKNAPEETIKTMAKINSQDKKISSFFKKIVK